MKNNEIKKDEEVIEIETNDVPAEPVEETKKPNKAVQVLKKIAPFAVIGGAIAAAFAFGRSSGADAAYLAMLDEETEDEDDEGSEEETTASDDEA